MSRTLGIVVLFALAGLWPARATASRRLTVGVCMPEVAFSGALERHDAAKRVAQHLARALRRPVDGLAYLNAQDLRRDIRTGTLDFAVVGPLFASTVPEEQILAQGRMSSGADGVWSILCRAKQELSTLRGKRLQIPRLGPGTLKLLQDGVLGGKLDVKSGFRLQWSPDLLSAQLAVRLGQADAVLAPLSSPDLVPVLKGYPLPPPAFVLVNRQVPAATVEAAQKAILALHVGVSSIKGWGPPDVRSYRQLEAFAGRRELRMVLIPERGIPLDVHDLVRGEVLVPRMPELDEPLGIR